MISLLIKKFISVYVFQFIDVIIRTSDYDIRNLIVMQKTRGPLEPVKLHTNRVNEWQP